MVRTYSGPPFTQHSGHLNPVTLITRVFDEIPVYGPNRMVLLALASWQENSDEELFMFEQWALDARIPMSVFLRRLERLLAAKWLTCVDGVYEINLPGDRS